MRLPTPLHRCALRATSLFALTAAALTSFASAQGDGPGLAREQMWRAPTAEEWAKPVQIQWQRSWDDAVNLAKQTGKPLLACVNMDGEIASEHYAGVRYRAAEVGALYEPYVCVIASVYRHNARDFDDSGKRIPCPRFGTVTCGEHIAIEPILFEKFLDGRRIAPRHIMIEFDENGQGDAMKETYDVFYAFDTKSVFDQIKNGILLRTKQAKDIARGDRSITERVGSPDSDDRRAVETAYVEGDKEMKTKLLEAAVAAGDQASADLLRLAIFGLDIELSELARKSLAQSDSKSSIDVINEALQVAMPDAEREALVGALERIGSSSERARTLARVHRGLSGGAAGVDVSGWTEALVGSEYPAPKGWDELAAAVDASERSDDSAESLLATAESTLRLAVDDKTAEVLAADTKRGSQYQRLMYEDARRAAKKAAQRGATGWRVDSALALTAYYLGEVEEAHRLVEPAAQGMPPGEESWNAMATLSLFAAARQKAIGDRIMKKEKWPSSWLADVHSTYAVLAKHPLGTANQVAEHFDFVNWLGARRRARRILESGLARFPVAWQLHARLRDTTLRNGGVRGLTEEYDRRLASQDSPPNLVWFAGYASIVAAEFDRRSGKTETAAASYSRAIEQFAASVTNDPANASSANHYTALALAGRARIALDGGNLDSAVTDLTASFALMPKAAATPDGLNISPADSAKLLRQRLIDDKNEALLAKLQTSLDALDASMLALPAYENAVPADAIPGQGR